MFASLSDRTGKPQLLPDVFPSGLLPDPRVALVRDVAAMGNILGVEVFHSRVSTSASMDVIKKTCLHMSSVFFMCSIDFFCLRNADCPTKHASNLTFGCTMCFWMHEHIASGQPHECSAPSAGFGTLRNFLAQAAKGQTRHHGQHLGRTGLRVILGFKLSAGPGKRFLVAGDASQHQPNRAANRSMSN